MRRAPQGCVRRLVASEVADITDGLGEGGTARVAHRPSRLRAAGIVRASTRVQCAHSTVEASLIVDSTVAARLRGKGSPGKLNFMCRIMFAAVAAAVALSQLRRC